MPMSMPTSVLSTYPLRSTTAPFRWMNEAGKMPWKSRSHQHPEGHSWGAPRLRTKGTQPGNATECLVHPQQGQDKPPGPQ